MVRRVAFVGVALCVASCFVVAQGGQGGGGFGGGGGAPGAAGGVGGRTPVTGDEATFRQILTPGDKGEWTIDAKEGETIVANAKSSIFDPALEVVDDKNTVLASNDDIEPGVQSARLLYRFPKAGAYRVWVKGYKSAAGGQFEFTLRRFLPVEASSAKLAPSTLDNTGTQWFRFHAVKGKPLVIRAKAISFEPSLDLIGPTGEVVESDLEDGDLVRHVLRDAKTGDYYARVRGSAKNASFTFGIAPVPVYVIPIGSQTESRHLNADDVEIATIDVNPGEFIRVDATSNGPPVLVATGSMESERDTDVIRRIYSTGLKGNWASHLATKKGQLVLTIFTTSDLATDYRISVSKPVKEFGSPTVSGKLPMGGIEYFAFQGKKGELVELGATSSQFDPHLRLITPAGVSLRDDDDSGENNDAKIVSLLPEDGAYYVAVACSGMGGAGDYKVSRRTIAPMSLDMGPAKTPTIGAKAIQVWTFQGKSGQTAILNVTSKTARLMVTVFGPRGEEMRYHTYDPISILKLPDDGTYTVWIQADAGSGEYRIRLIDAD